MTKIFEETTFERCYKCGNIGKAVRNLDKTWIIYCSTDRNICGNCTSYNFDLNSVIEEWNNLNIKNKGDTSKEKIYQEIVEERERQYEKLGERNYPMLNSRNRVENMKTHAHNFRVINASTKYKCWHDVLMGEVYEVFAETDPVKQRENLIQTAAVVVRIIECLDRNSKNWKNKEVEKRKEDKK